MDSGGDRQRPDRTCPHGCTPSPPLKAHELGGENIGYRWGAVMGRDLASWGVWDAWKILIGSFWDFDLRSVHSFSRDLILRFQTFRTSGYPIWRQGYGYIQFLSIFHIHSQESGLCCYPMLLGDSLTSKNTLENPKLQSWNELREDEDVRLCQMSQQYDSRVTCLSAAVTTSLAKKRALHE